MPLILKSKLLEPAETHLVQIIWEVDLKIRGPGGDMQVVCQLKQAIKMSLFLQNPTSKMT